MEELPTWSRLTSGQAPLPVHAARPYSRHQAGHQAACRTWSCRFRCCLRSSWSSCPWSTPTRSSSRHGADSSPMEFPTPSADVEFLRRPDDREACRSWSCRHSQAVLPLQLVHPLRPWKRQGRPGALPTVISLRPSTPWRQGRGRGTQACCSGQAAVLRPWGLRPAIREETPRRKSRCRCRCRSRPCPSVSPFTSWKRVRQEEKPPLPPYLRTDPLI